MSERNDADGFNKSMSVLRDVTNRLGKRGFSEREKSGVESYSLSDKDTVNHVRVSPSRYTNLDLLKGYVLSRSSKVSTENNKDQDLDISCEEYPYIGGGVDAIKTYSCSFCTKAAYIWLDLNYQDIKGRVSALRKSQKDVCILA